MLYFEKTFLKNVVWKMLCISYLSIYFFQAEQSVSCIYMIEFYS